MLGGDTTLLDAFKSANQVLQGAVQGIAELITRPGLINVDFADVRTVMSEMGMANVIARSAFLNQVDEELCVACELCIPACPPRAMETKL